MRRLLASIYGFALFVFGRFSAEGSRYAGIAIMVAIAAVLVDDFWPQRERENDRG